jgi:hypothetical protein
VRERRRRFTAVLLAALMLVAGAIYESFQAPPTPHGSVQSVTTTLDTGVISGSAAETLAKLEVKGRAPKTGYKRSHFGQNWEQLGACDVRNHILKRDLTNVVVRSDTDCTVVSGMLLDPYTGKTIPFIRGETTSDDVQVDHVVALSDAWQKGAQQLNGVDRIRFANDPLNLLAVEGEANNQKSDSDAASWLPPNKDYRCRYIARQIAVKAKYRLWVTSAERDAMNRVLTTCPTQQLPVVADS